MYRVVSLFTGMGGMDLGFAGKVIVPKESVSKKFVECENELTDFVELKSLPFKIVFQNDILPIAEKILDLNGWKHNFHLTDINKLLEAKFEFPKCDVVIGGFPCQDFSHAGKRQGFESKRGNLYTSFVEVVKQTKPKIFIAENVYGLLTMPNKPIETIIKDFSDVGYTVKYQLLKAEEIGIPQKRWRVIIMGISNKHIKNITELDWNLINVKKTCHIRSYLSHLEEPENSDDPAQTVYSMAKRLEKGQGQTEINMDGFSPTIRAEHHGNIEFRRHNGGINCEDELNERRLTVREASLIQTFPPNCKLTLKKKSMVAYKTIGNAVPPLLAYHIATKVLSLLIKMKM